MAKAGDIEIKLKVDTKKFTKDMQKAEKAAKKFSTNTDKNVKKMSSSVKGSLMAVKGALKGLAGAFAAFQGVSFARDLVTDITTLSRETTAWSRTLNIGTTELQAFGLAASQVGFSSEKVADIFKDVSDKLGDFIATGGGEAKNVFERLGLSIEDLKGKAPDKALQLIVDQMDKLKGTAKELNQQEKIFLLEAIANDASKLIPLLENSGAELEKFKKVAKASGAILSPKDLKAIEQYRKESKVIGLKWKGIKNTLAVAVLPIMKGMLTVAEGLVKAFSVLPKLAGALGTALSRPTAILSALTEGLGVKAQTGDIGDLLAPTNTTADKQLQPDSIEKIMRGLLKDRAATEAAKIQKEAADKQSQAAEAQKSAAETVKKRSETAIGQMLSNRGKGEAQRILGPGPKQAQSDEFDRIFRDLVSAIQSGDVSERSKQFSLDMLNQIASSQKTFGAAGSELGMVNAIKDLQNFISGKKDDQIKVDIKVDVKPSDKFDTELETKIERINGNSFGDAAAQIGQ
jgi:hypothetical protein